jgi:hypothetical protein
MNKPVALDAPPPKFNPRVGIEGLVVEWRRKARALRAHGDEGDIKAMYLELESCANDLETALARQRASDLAWCAVDRDECTVTLAFDTEDQVNKFIANRTSRKRVRVMDEQPAPITYAGFVEWFNHCGVQDRPPSQLARAAWEAALAAQQGGRNDG